MSSHLHFVETSGDDSRTPFEEESPRTQRAAITGMIEWYLEENQYPTRLMIYQSMLDVYQDDGTLDGKIGSILAELHLSEPARLNIQLH